MGWAVLGGCLGSAITLPLVAAFAILVKVPIAICDGLSSMLDKIERSGSRLFWRRWNAAEEPESSVMCVPGMTYVCWLIIALVVTLLFGSHNGMNIGYNLQMLAIGAVLFLALVAVAEWRRGYTALPAAIVFGLLAVCLFLYSGMLPTRNERFQITPGLLMFVPAAYSFAAASVRVFLSASRKTYLQRW